MPSPRPLLSAFKRVGFPLSKLRILYPYPVMPSSVVREPSVQISSLFGQSSSWIKRNSSRARLHSTVSLLSSTDATLLPCLMELWKTSCGILFLHSGNGSSSRIVPPPSIHIHFRYHGKFMNSCSLFGHTKRTLFAYSARRSTVPSHCESKCSRLSL